MIVPVYPTMPTVKTKPVTSLPQPRTDKIYDIHVYEPNKGTSILSWQYQILDINFVNSWIRTI